MPVGAGEQPAREASVPVNLVSDQGLRYICGYRDAEIQSVALPQSPSPALMLDHLLRQDPGGALALSAGVCVTSAPNKTGLCLYLVFCLYPTNLPVLMATGQGTDSGRAVRTPPRFEQPRGTRVLFLLAQGGLAAIPIRWDEVPPNPLPAPPAPHGRQSKRNQTLPAVPTPAPTRAEFVPLCCSSRG